MTTNELPITDTNEDEPVTPLSADAPPSPIVQADQLFAGHREIWIEHHGVRYRLRITRRNKLILQK